MCNEQMFPLAAHLIPEAVSSSISDALLELVLCALTAWRCSKNARRRAEAVADRAFASSSSPPPQSTCRSVSGRCSQPRSPAQTLAARPGRGNNPCQIP